MLGYTLHCILSLGLLVLDQQYLRNTSFHQHAHKHKIREFIFDLVVCSVDQLIVVRRLLQLFELALSLVLLGDRLIKEELLADLHTLGGSFGSFFRFLLRSCL